MTHLPPPLVPGKDRPKQGTEGIGIKALELTPIPTLPLLINSHEGMVVRLTDGKLYHFQAGAWVEIIGGSLTQAAADLLYRKKASYIHNQAIASALWTITHNLDTFPVVAIEDSTGEVVEGVVRYVSVNQLTVEFAAPFAGKALLA